MKRWLPAVVLAVVAAAIWIDRLSGGTVLRSIQPIRGAALTLLLGLLVETILPNVQRPWARRLNGFQWRIVQLVVAVAIVVPLSAALKPHLPSWAPLIHLDCSAAFILGPFAGLWVYDFFFYWCHRLQHAVPFLWRLHSVHHSVRDLGAFNQHNHWTEDLLQVFLITLPMTLVVGVTVPDVYVSALWVQFYPLIIHADTRLQYGPLRYLFVEPRHHRLHHSLNPEHFDRNFGGYFPLWDVLFGTVRFPRKGETFETGIPGHLMPRTVVDGVLARLPPTSE